ncbi:MAG TPA: N-acetylmannosamine-6-phosphate 2-epimerase [bacterium]|nr:N-acetylmannosamine-6-phosphate 2-epimerase [bacterium]
MLPFPKGLVVSCQSNPGDALHGSHFMQAMAVAAQKGGAVAIRANGPADIAAIKAVTALPVIGIWRIYDPGCEVYITPTFESAQVIRSAGAEVIAFDATSRKRPKSLTLAELVRQLKALNTPLMADISTYEEGCRAAELGVDIIATTLAGFTGGQRMEHGAPDLNLLQQLIANVNLPVIAEGRYTTPELVRQAMQMGAYAVVVGKAITQPEFIVRKFVQGVSGCQSVSG